MDGDFFLPDKENRRSMAGKDWPDGVQRL